MSAIRRRRTSEERHREEMDLFIRDLRVAARFLDGASRAVRRAGSR